jgi:general stress protein YciG
MTPARLCQAPSRGGNLKLARAFPLLDSASSGFRSRLMASKSSERSSGNTSRRGFASMDAEKQRAIARKGGQSVSPQDRSFSRNHALAAEAGRKGGRSVSPQDRSFARDPGLAAEAGRKGGERSGSGRTGGEGSEAT